MTIVVTGAAHRWQHCHGDAGASTTREAMVARLDPIMRYGGHVVTQDSTDTEMYGVREDEQESWLTHYRTHGDGGTDCMWCIECGPPSQYTDDDDDDQS